MTIYEFMLFSREDGFDIADNIFDWGNYFGVDLHPYEQDSYNVLMIYFANNIEMVNYNKNWYSSCKVSEFIQSHRQAFDKFMRMVNNENYQPDDSVTFEDEEFCDLYLSTFESLINGNYAEEDYELLYELLLEN
jgi:hypothetical protein